MRLLALETTGEVCSICASQDGKPVAVLTFAHGMQLSTRLIPFIDHVLNTAGWQMADVDAFAVGLGPGSFTGTRVGVMTAKTFAQALAKPIVGVCSLDVLAGEYAFIPHQVVCAVVPARKGEVYACVYEGGSEFPQPVTERAVYTVQSLHDILLPFIAGDVVLVGSVPTDLRMALADYPVCIAPVEYPRAELLGRLGTILLQQGHRDNPLTLVPMYLKPPAITMPKNKA
ncbi:MAG: tRNA (adenosine(37)-N6)-threonylcarbamoyltransferase complex dimerization subunit type 1 TsaB [Chthonomonadetes bacterium]|nr:tRNA (adenosine(37)-N6)-threonylcarbamoyltransferase complex dimerization subunit type 1 TsaB [Chthonomonadetes bacterium]